MNKIKVLNENDIRKIINLKMTISAVENAYKQKSNNKGSIWPLVFYEYEHNVFDLDIRSGNLKESNAYGLKLISYNENNSTLNLSKVNATALIFNDKTGEPLALLNAAPITSYRTGAAAAIGAKYLAKKDSKNLLIIGTGNIAKYATAATLIAMPYLENVYIYNPRRRLSDYEIKDFNYEVGNLLEECDAKSNINIQLVEDIKSAVFNSDIIITTTPSEIPLIQEDWVKKGTHFSCMGACIVGKQEIDEKLFKCAKIYADDELQCIKQGESQSAFNKKIVTKFDGEIGDIILNKKKGRSSNDDITIFDSTGLFLQDLATSMELLKKAEQESMGITIEI